MTDLASYRQFYAEEIDALANLKTDQLVAALASVPRERFLPPSPWFARGELDTRGPRQTKDDDPRRVYHNGRRSYGHCTGERLSSLQCPKERARPRNRKCCKALST